MRLALCALAAMLLLTLNGCSQPTISGTVTFDGQPVTDGQMAFVPESNSGQGSSAHIVNGAYTLKAAAGNYKVEINASKLMPLPPGQKGMDGATEEVRSYIPERYNTKTELKADVTKTAKLDFELKSS
jgi:hypothetical protein